MQRILLLVAGLFLGGLAGYVYTQRNFVAERAEFEKQQRQIRAEFSQVDERAKLAQVVGRLGTVLVKAEQKDFAAARERSTRFFDSVRAIEASATDGNVKQALRQVMSRRDEITSDLAVSSELVIPKLREMYTSLQALVD